MTATKSNQPHKNHTNAQEQQQNLTEIDKAPPPPRSSLFFLLYPHARVLVLIPLGFFSQLVRLPAGWVLALWFAIQIFSSAISNSEGGGVAWFAHIGGFVAGMALVPLFKQKRVKLFMPGHGSRKYTRRVGRHD